MAHDPRRQQTAEDKKNLRVGCGVMLAALLVIGGCGALVDGGKDASSSVSSSASSPGDEPRSVTVKDYVGMGLQAAQDAAQGDGIRRLDSTDATGRNRQQLWDRNWTVCAQTPAAGASMSAEDTLTFDTVKSSAGESCTGRTGTGTSEAPSVSGTDDSPAASVTEDDGPSSAGAGTGDDHGDDSTGDDSGSSNSSSGSSGDDSGSSSSSGGEQQAPAGATARCSDGTYSYSAHRRGTCSHHGGVAVWLAGAPS
ncbi:DUF3761 domain-containing protein [Streptomyces sp. NPDC047017]|uniref:DUF3761 domain-containing protein n=1 Tax=Streptomyces sp. NPDC047017 TaxID=3155024 RepID=UPI0033D063C3